MKTAGFYKYEEDLEEVYYSPNFVYARDYELLRELHDTYNYPVDGWYWFDTFQQAQKFFNTTYDFNIQEE